MPAGLGAAGWLAICFEEVMGTYLPPTTTGTIWVPILSETLDYNEQPYYSEQIRQETVEVDREQGYYHVEGDIVMEFDANFAPYFMYCSRHLIDRTNGTGGDPNLYEFTPSQMGAASNTLGVEGARTASVTIVRNGVGFGYFGCVFHTIEATIDTGILKLTLGTLGLGEVEPAGLGTPAWIDPSLMGAASHAVYVDAAGTDPAFASASNDFNGFTANINYNGSPQNRINGQRSAAYISYGKTEPTYTTELDFLDRDEYDAFVNNDRRAVRLESIKGGEDWESADEGFQLTYYNTAYDTYPVQLSGMADLIMANVTGRALAMTGGDPVKIAIKSHAEVPGDMGS